MKNNEIVYVCHSINNKNVRGLELKILRKFKDENYFEFGENEMNIKKRFYSDEKILEKDYAELEKIKSKIEKNVNKTEEKNINKTFEKEPIRKRELKNNMI